MRKFRQLASYTEDYVDVNKQSLFENEIQKILAQIKQISNEELKRTEIYTQIKLLFNGGGHLSESFKDNKLCHANIIQLLGFIYRHDNNLYSEIVNEILLNPEMYVAEILFFIKKLDSKIFNAKLNTLKLIDQTMINLRLNSIKDSLLVKQVSKLGLQMGNSDYESALLVAASNQDKKSYKLNSIIFKNIHEFENFIQIIRENFNKVVPLEVNFIIPGQHWSSGKISIDHNNEPYAEGEERKKVNLLIMEPLSPKLSFAMDIIRPVCTRFPSVEVYVNKEKMQNSNQGCQAFAFFLGLLKISSLESKFSEIYQDSHNIFDYIEKYIKNSRTRSQTATINGNNKTYQVPIYMTILPLPFLQLSETSKILDSDYLVNAGYQKSEVDATNLTKSNQKLPEKWKKHFKYDDVYQKTQNSRLHQIFIKILERATIYCITHKDEEIQDSMRSFTFDAANSKLTTSPPIRKSKGSAWQ